MKIPAIQPFNKNFTKYNISCNLGINYITLPQLNEFSSQNILSNYNKVNFCANNYEINDEYFALPQGLKPDDYQKQAAKYLQKGESVLVSAPTGTGKTAIAQYIISKNLNEGKKTFYTTPLKALSNQKLLEFRKIYGDENVGILTGDRKENPNAPIVVMTTEVYRNMAFDKYFNDNNNISDNVSTVIFDEFHYLGDHDRGASWEESILFSSPQTQLLGLSATIGNDEQLAKWLNSIRNKDVKLVHVPSENRNVPLKFYGYEPKKGILFDIQKTHKQTLPKKTEKHSKLMKRKNKNSEQKLPYVDDYIDVVSKLSKMNQLPAILFIFNKKFSFGLLDAFCERGKDLTNYLEKEEINKIFDKYKNRYGYLGDDINKDALLKGYAVHNAGILPVQKEMVEELFNKKLVKTVIATETLAAGINMPARTVVISSCDKPTSDPKAINGRRNLTANEFQQMAGRAGRRGIDTIGYVVTLCVNQHAEDTFKTLVGSEPNPIYSVFTPDFSLISNYHKYTKNSERIKNIFANSFKIFSSGDGNNKKINAMYSKYEAKSKLLRDMGFLNIFNNSEKTLNPNGYLLPDIVGYPQIPIIHTITSHSLKNISPEELIFFASAIVGGQYHVKNLPDEELFMEKVTPSDFIKSDINIATRGHLDVTEDLVGIDNLLNKYNCINQKYNNLLQKYAIEDEMMNTPNYQIGSLVYVFGYLNSKINNNSIKNWQTATSIISPDGVIRDEGSYYNVINQTIDLLSQMIDVCNDTKNIYEFKYDTEYYDKLSKKLKKAVKLLKQEPMQKYLYE